MFSSAVEESPTSKQGAFPPEHPVDQCFSKCHPTNPVTPSGLHGHIIRGYQLPLVQCARLSLPCLILLPHSLPLLALLQYLALGLAQCDSTLGLPRLPGLVGFPETPFRSVTCSRDRSLRTAVVEITQYLLKWSHWEFFFSVD